MLRVLNWRSDGGTAPLELAPTSKVVFLARRYRLAVTLVMTPTWMTPDRASPGTLIMDTAWATYGWLAHARSLEPAQHH